MKVLIVHNKYRTSAPSGEDVAVGNEQRMLEDGGVEVVAFERCNDDLDDSSMTAKTSMAINTIWSQRSRSELRQVLRRTRPDVVHVHNTFSVISPSIYGACKAEGVPVVQTLHNFRFFCPPHYSSESASLAKNAWIKACCNRCGIGAIEDP